MASIRVRNRKDGIEYYAVLFRQDGKQSSLSFDDCLTAARFCDQANKFGVQNALAILNEASVTALTVEQWIIRHLDHLTGVEPETVKKYRAYLRNDVGPALGDIPLAALRRDHIVQWVKTMEEPDGDGRKPRAKTIRNKHGFLAGALNAAIPEHIVVNPCDGIKLNRDEDYEMLFLTPEQFNRLHAAVTEPWRPLVKFLVATGCRWGEATALRPSDINRDAGTVNIARGWKSGAGRYRLGPPKTAKSKRTINVPASVLDILDYSHEFLFTNRSGGPVRSHGFIRRVWTPAVNRAWPCVDEHGQPITDLSVQILRPRIHDLRHTAASWMIQRGVVLPVVRDHLGHESIQTTVDRYGHLDRRSMATASAAIGEALGDIDMQQAG
ncbi:MAG: tyrosine-type recombinase/integrase [Actinomycetes bacterium]